MLKTWVCFSFGVQAITRSLLLLLSVRHSYGVTETMGTGVKGVAVSVAVSLAIGVVVSMGVPVVSAVVVATGVPSPTVPVGAGTGGVGVETGWLAQ